MSSESLIIALSHIVYKISFNVWSLNIAIFLYYEISKNEANSENSKSTKNY